MEEHEKALMLLVHQLQDYTGAEQYCMENSVVSVHESCVSPAVGGTVCELLAYMGSRSCIARHSYTA